MFTARSIIDGIKAITNTSMTQIVSELNKLDDKTTKQSLSNKFKRGSMKFSDVEKILNTMNYTLLPVPITDTTEVIKLILLQHLSEEELNEFMMLLSDPRVTYSDKVLLRNKLVHSDRDPLILTKEFIIETYERLHDKM